MKKFEISSDLKDWYAISCPTTGVRFDAATLAFLDSDGDGRVRSDELIAALAFLKEHNISVSSLFTADPTLARMLEENLDKQSDLAKVAPSEDDVRARADWMEKGRSADVAVCGEATGDAEAALTAVEKTIDAFFTPPDDLPLVTDEPDCVLPLAERLNPKFQEAILDFAVKCVRPFYGAEKATLSRLEWKAVREKFAPYRAWRAAEPRANGAALESLKAEEKLVRYRQHLGEFLKNYVTMDNLYSTTEWAIFQTGVLRIDGKELSLCFHVESEADHAALADRSKCCVVYAKLTRASEAERMIAAVVTAGTIGGLYAGRRGVFYDRDGRDWEAVVTKVVVSQVSLAEAFWAPWRKLGEAVGAAVKKYLGDRQAKATAAVQQTANGAALASSVAAVGIGVGMLGAAAASIMAAVSGMKAHEIVLSVVLLVLLVSLPSVILTWFKLRRRDLGAVLNASGWAINRPMRISLARARLFTRCARRSVDLIAYAVGILVLLAILGVSWYHFHTGC